MLIRTEAPADILAVDRLLKEVFDTEAEANLVMALRENGHRTLSLVACDDEGEVVGHAMFSPVHLNGEDLNWQGLAPLAVKAEYRKQGLGAELVHEGLASLGELGYPACVVLGTRPTIPVLVLRLPMSRVFAVSGMYQLVRSRLSRCGTMN